MNWQTWIVAVVVAVAVLYLGRQVWRTWRPKKPGCGGGCGCSKAATPVQHNGHVTVIPSDQLTRRLRQRDGS